eukprot:10203391-Heterocapsa_arctica.AAC.1
MVFAYSDCPRKGARFEVPFESYLAVAALAGEDVSMSASPGACNSRRQHAPQHQGPGKNNMPLANWPRPAPRPRRTPRAAA